MDLFFYSIFLYLAGGIIQGFVPRARGGFKTGIFAAFSALATVLLVILSLRVILSGFGVSAALAFHFPIGNIPVAIDALAAFFILVIAIVGFITVLYSWWPLRMRNARSLMRPFITWWPCMWAWFS